MVCKGSFIAPPAPRATPAPPGGAAAAARPRPARAAGGRRGAAARSEPRPAAPGVLPGGEGSADAVAEGLRSRRGAGPGRGTHRAPPAPGRRRPCRPARSPSGCSRAASSPGGSGSAAGWCTPGERGQPPARRQPGRPPRSSGEEQPSGEAPSGRAARRKAEPRARPPAPAASFSIAAPPPNLPVFPLGEQNLSSSFRSWF